MAYFYRCKIIAELSKYCNRSAALSKRRSLQPVWQSPACIIHSTLSKWPTLQNSTFSDTYNTGPHRSSDSLVLKSAKGPMRSSLHAQRTRACARKRQESNRIKDQTRFTCLDGHYISVPGARCEPQLTDYLALVTHDILKWLNLRALQVRPRQPEPERH